jgi:Ni/Fe-hydrogenase subunit HybB-like protein
VSFVPGEMKVYFPTVPELFMSVGYVALTVVAFSYAVKVMAIFPGPLDTWFEAVQHGRRKLGLKVNTHGKATHD